MVKICKSWEQQVLENSNKLEELEPKVTSTKAEVDGLATIVDTIDGKVDSLEDDVANNTTALSNLDGRALKLPVQKPYGNQIVIVDSTGAQRGAYIGPGLFWAGDQLMTVETPGTGGSGSWEKHEISLTDVSDTFSFDNGDSNPIMFSIQASGGYYSGVLNNNIAATYPPAISTPFFLPGASGLITCYIKSDDGTCSIEEASTGSTPTISGDIYAISYWVLE